LTAFEKVGFLLCARADGECNAGYIFPEQRVSADHPLRPIRAMVNAVLRTLSSEFNNIYSIDGHPSIAPERLPRFLLMQVLYTVRSERMMMEHLPTTASHKLSALSTSRHHEAGREANTLTKPGIDVADLLTARSSR
jgi:hypothetical protein